MATRYRQGDVLVTRVRTLPKRAEPKAAVRGRLVLAEGEATGHAHAIDATLAELFEGRDGRLYLRVGAEGAAVEHEEHAAIPLPPGTYRVTRQREYSPEEIRRVAD